MEGREDVAEAEVGHVRPLAARLEDARRGAEGGFLAPKESVGRGATHDAPAQRPLLEHPAPREELAAGNAVPVVGLLLAPVGAEVETPFLFSFPVSIWQADQGGPLIRVFRCSVIKETSREIGAGAGDGEQRVLVVVSHPPGLGGPLAAVSLDDAERVDPDMGYRETGGEGDDVPKERREGGEGVPRQPRLQVGRPGAVHVLVGQPAVADGDVGAAGARRVPEAEFDRVSVGPDVDASSGQGRVVLVDLLAGQGPRTRSVSATHVEPGADARDEKGFVGGFRVCENVSSHNISGARSGIVGICYDAKLKGDSGLVDIFKVPK